MKGWFYSWKSRVINHISPNCLTRVWLGCPRSLTRVGRQISELFGLEPTGKIGCIGNYWKQFKFEMHKNLQSKVEKSPTFSQPSGWVRSRSEMVVALARSRRQNVQPGNFFNRWKYTKLFTVIEDEFITPGLSDKSYWYFFPFWVSV